MAKRGPKPKVPAPPPIIPFYKKAWVRGVSFIRLLYKNTWIRLSPLFAGIGYLINFFSASADVPSGIQNWLIWTGYSFEKTAKDSVLVCSFPKKFQKDTLYILVTRFEDDILAVESDCYGESLRSSINKIAYQKNIPIRVCYNKNITIRDDLSKAKQIQQEFNADLVLYGTIRNIQKSCTAGNICFSSEPSDTLIHLAGGDVSLRKFDTKYEKSLNPMQLEQGEFHINNKRFYDWLFVFYNTKIGKFNPDLYAIDEGLTPKEKAKEYFEKTKLYYNLGNFEKVIENCNISLKYNQDNPLVYGFRGAAFLDKKELKKALADCNRAISLDNNYSIAYNVRGIVKQKNSEFEKSIVDFNKALELNSDSSEAAVYYANRGYSKQQLELTQDALIDYNKSIGLKTKYPLPFFWRAELKSSKLQFEEALVDYTRAITLNPKNDIFWSARGFAKSESKDYKGAIDDFSKAIELNTKDIITYISRGRTKEIIKDNLGALDDYNKAINLDPQDDVGFIYRAKLKVVLGDFNGAISDYSKVIELNPQHDNSYHNRGTLFYHLKEYNKAMSDYNKAIALNPKEGNYYYNRGNLSNDLGKKHEAEKDLKKAKLLGYNKITSKGGAK